MEKLAKELLSLLSKGDASSFTALLLAVICALGWWCHRLIAQLERKDDKVYKIIDDYSKNNLTIAQAMDNLKAVLTEIKTRL